MDIMMDAPSAPLLSRLRVAAIQRRLEADARRACEVAGELHGFGFVSSGCTYDTAVGSITVTLELGKLGEDGRPMTLAAFWLRERGHLYGLPSNAYGRTITLRGKTLRIIGLKPNASKRNIVLEDEAERSYVAVGTEVARILKAEDEVTP